MELPAGVSMVEIDDEKPDTSNIHDSRKSQQVSLLRLACLNKPEIPELILGSLAAVVLGALLPLFGIVFSQTSFYEPAHELQRKSRIWVFLFIVVGSASLLATPLQTYFFGVAGCKLIRRVRLMCFEKVVHMEIGWFDRLENSSGKIGSRLSVDATCVRSLVGENISILVQNCTTALAGLPIGFEANWELSIIVLLLLPLIGLHGYMGMKFFKGFSGDAKKAYEDATQVASDAVESIRTVASFSAEDNVIQLYEKKCRGPVDAGIKHAIFSGIGYGLSMFFLNTAYATIFYAGAHLIKAGRTTFLEVFQVFYGLSLAGIAISQSSVLSPDSSKGRAGASSIFAILDQESKIDSSENSGMVLDDVKGDIVFQHVRFRYPSRPNIEIFKDLCLEIQSGKTVALVGESGSGKSTVVSLLQRFYDPNSGEITLDGVELRRLNLKWLRQKMGLVSQEPVLFNGTIRENIAYGKEGNATEGEIIAAAETANAHSFISGLQQGYDTLVGERGIQLSGGQKQRVAIARAIVRSPRILLLDEATSALDAESERVVQDALDRAMIGKSTVVVAHRLSTIKNADLIAVVRNGVIEEKGSHKILMNIKDGIYASLVVSYSGAFM